MTEQLLKYYDEECMKIFDAAVMLNAKYPDTLELDRLYDNEFEYTVKCWQGFSGAVVVYGIGSYGERFFRYAKKENLRIDAFVVSDGENMTPAADCLSGGATPIYELRNLPYKHDECLIIIAIKDIGARISIKKKLMEKSYLHIF